MVISWKTERRSVAALKDYSKNPRQFTEKGLADLKASLQSLGYIDPIAINLDGTIIGGHARKKTLLELGLNEVDVRVPDRQLTEKQVAEAIVRLNKNHAGTWDFAILQDCFDQRDLLDWGFERSEFNAFGQGDKPSTDAPVIIPSVAVTAPGDQWMLGNHSIRCGDSTDHEHVSLLLAGRDPVLMVTDPPYGVNYDPSWRDRVDGVLSSSRAVGKVANDDKADWTEAWKLFPGNVVYIWHAGIYSAAVQQSLEAAGFQMRGQIIWVKQHFVFGRGDYHWQHEPCWYAVRKGKKGNWHGGRKQSTTWQIANASASGGSKDDTTSGHGTQKPVECMKRPIENNSQPGDLIYEPFSGSGTTIIAAEMTGRACLAMELDPLYVDMAVLRWQNFTGRKAVHAVTGAPFPTPALPLFAASNEVEKQEVKAKKKKAG